MIRTAGTEFLKYAFRDSIKDTATIVKAEASDDKEILIEYLSSIDNLIKKWIKEIEKHENND